MAQETPYIIITIIAIAIMIVIALIWIPVVRAPPLVPQEVTYAPATYGSRCTSQTITPQPMSSSPADFTPQPCAESLVCVKVNPVATTGFCKKVIGAPCNTVDECEPGARFCLGVCSREATGGLNQPCSVTVPCNEGLACSQANVCKYIDGTEGCTVSADCLDGACLTRSSGERYCAPRHPNGHACTSHYDCLSDHCDSKGFCQAPGVESNTLGAACLYFQGGAPTCPTGTTCAVNIQEDPHTYGTCTVESTEWTSSPCTAHAPACIPPTVCYKSQCVMPRTDDSFQTNSCAPGVSSGICAVGFACVTGTCQAVTSAVPAPSQPGNEVWSLLEWQRSPGIGQWRSVRRDIPAPVGLNTFTAFTPANSGGVTLFLYRAATGFYFLTSTTAPIRLTIQGPYNGTVLLSQIDHLQFQIDAVRFTPMGRVAISYSWLMTDLNGNVIRVNRVYIQSRPSDWSIPLTFQITWEGQTPNTNIEVGSPQQRYGRFYIYGVYGNRSIYFSKWFDVDDRGVTSLTDEVRFLLISTEGQLFVANTTLQAINTIYDGSTVIPFTQPLNDVIWAQYYSFKQQPDIPPIPTRLAFLYISAIAPQEIKFSVPPGQLPPNLHLPPSNFPDQTVNRMSLYSPLDGGVARSQMLYLVNYPSEGGRQLHLYDNGDFMLPGHYDTGMQVALSQGSISSTYILTTTL